MAPDRGPDSVALTTDIVVFSIRRGALSVLLVERANAPFRGCWALPGGFLDAGEDLDDCARRELEEETGVNDVYLEQLQAFGDVGRDPRGRVITVAYVALVPAGDLHVQAASDAADAGWHRMEALPDLAFDHGDIIACGHARLVAGFDNATVALQMMPGTFTLAQLQQVYETVGAAPLGESAFRERFLAPGAAEETGDTPPPGGGSPAPLYRAAGRSRNG